MKKLRRSECAVLPLVLKRRWYDMIDSGEKRRKEYREYKPYWRKRVLRWLYRMEETHVVAFSRGYRKPDMFFVACTSFNTRIGHERPDWGEPETQHYIIYLFERVNLEDWPMIIYIATRLFSWLYGFEWPLTNREVRSLLTTFSVVEFAVVCIALAFYYFIKDEHEHKD